VGQEVARRLATWVLLAASLAGAVLFVGLRVVTPSDGGRIVFYGDAWSPAGVRIEPIDAPAAGLEPGDRVEAVAERSLEAWIRAVMDADVARPVVGPVPYVVERDGARLSIEVAWAPPAIGGALTTGWSVLLFSVAIAGLAGYVFARRPGVPAATALMLVASGAAGSSLPWFVGVTTSDIVLGGPFLFHAVLTGGLYMLLWPAGVHLGLVFPTPLPVLQQRRWLIPAVYIGSLAAYGAAMAATFAASTSRLAWVGSWPSIQLAFVVPLLVVSILLFVRQYARALEPAEKARMRLAALGAGLSAVLGLVLFMGPELVLGESIIPAAAIGLTALPLPIGFAAAILRDRLFDIDAAINRTLVYGGLTLAVLGTYVVAIAIVTTVVGVDEGYAGSLLATGIVALVALPLRDALQRAINRLMYGDRDEPWRALHRLGSRLEWAADPDRALPAIAETVADALRLPYVAVEVTDELGHTVVAAEHGGPSQASATLPLVHGGEPVGRLVLGVRRGERGFRADELALLGDLARHAGAAVHAQRLRRDLAGSRERLVIAREEERRRLRRDLHDGLGPALAAIGLRAETAAAVVRDDPDTAAGQLEALAAETRDALADIRRLVDGLRPPALDELGLVGAIGSQASRLDSSDPTRVAGAAIHVGSAPSPLPELPAAVEVAAYRIAVEAMTNAVRHAGAQTCRVQLEAADQLTIEVVDDGRGLTETARVGTGLESMRERAAEVGGELSVERRAEGGTRVVARLPLGTAAAT
jgi:signal transduction histidine kinase